MPAGLADALRKSFSIRPGPSAAAARPGEVRAHADDDKQRRKAPELSAAGQLGSLAGLSSAGSSRVGAWQEPLDGSATAQVTVISRSRVVMRRRLCTSAAQARTDAVKFLLFSLLPRPLTSLSDQPQCFTLRKGSKTPPGSI